MSLDALVTLGVLSATLALLVRDAAAPSVIMMGASVLLMVARVITPEQALAGFSNPAPFAVAALYVLARGVEKTGGIQPLLRSALGRARTRGGALAGLVFPVGAASSLLNNTPIVAMIAPQVSAWARSTGQAPSRYLMPLSFAAILGGVTTAIGTSTNLVAGGLMEAHGGPAMTMFEISRLGLPVAVLGIAFLVIAAPRLLPDRVSIGHDPGDLTREYVIEMEVVPAGSLDGVSVVAGGLRDLAGVFLAEVARRDEVVAPAAPTTVLHGGDRLRFVGRSDDVLDLRNHPGLRSGHHEHSSTFHAAGHTHFEVVIGATSPLVGATLREIDFRNRYQAAVLAIHRAGAPVLAKLGTIRLHVGDTLLLLTDRGFRERWRDRPDFLLIAGVGGLAPTSSRQAWLVFLVLGGVVAGNAAGLFPILHGSLAGAFLLVLGRVLTAGEARQAVDLDVIILIAASFGLGSALETSGLAGSAAGAIVAGFSGLGPRGVLFGILLATVVLTEMVTNNAAMVLIYPIAMAVSVTYGLDPREVGLAVAVAASASFLTPIGYQTNTMVYGPGAYRFGDYARLGLPLTFLVVGLLVSMARV
jgi:di/tricarboxylate transporter